MVKNLAENATQIAQEAKKTLKRNANFASGKTIYLKLNSNFAIAEFAKLFAECSALCIGIFSKMQLLFNATLIKHNFAFYLQILIFFFFL